MKEVAVLKKRVVERDVPSVRTPCHLFQLRLCYADQRWMFMGHAIAETDQGDSR